ncbi:MAG TPA: hypothetical protein VLX44_11090 [Xanthobacteraceae bacterium]|nr:hypothetical protein [Xanthobacteraceae bacterium]
MKAIAAIALAAAVVAPVFPAAAQTLAAVVEEVHGSAAGVGFMDYVETGRVIRLGPKDSVVLGYLKSCTRETITGGTITVGVQHSDVKAGTVERAIIPCDAERMLLTSEPRHEAAGLAFRSAVISDGGQPSGRALPEPEFTLYGASPVIQGTGGERIVIERLDASDKRHVVRLTTGRLGDVFDFAGSGAALAPGGLYRAVANRHTLVFRIDSSAQPGRTPVCGRLIRLPAAS